MINERVVNAVLKCATPASKDLVIKTIIDYVNRQYDYQDNKAGHILEMLVDDKAFIESEHINMDYINDNLSKLIYNYEKWNIKDVVLEYIDNIDCVAIINYKYMDKVNEDRDDVEWNIGRISINFIDTPDILKK